MNPVALTVLLLSSVAILVCPRRWAPLPLMVGACYITRAQGLELGPYSFTVVRILVLVGVLRVVVRREWLSGGLTSLDHLMVLWGIWMVVSGLFHADAVVTRLGLAFDGWGLYFLFRIFCRSADEFASLCRFIALMLVPIAVEMVVEKATANNIFSAFGGVASTPSIRDGRVRAQGPFGHSILAGNIGAVTLPLMIGLWGYHRLLGTIGVLACAAMVFASSSSGPVMSAVAAVAASVGWRYRLHTRKMLRLAVASYLVLELIMEDHAYYIMARIDIAGGSTGWHRARLIDAAFQHLGEWWLIGTDYTRHWMPSGVSWSANHTDITNHYLRMGVLGGLPLVLLFIFTLTKGFSMIGRALRQQPELPRNSQFLLWACGASLFTHAVTCISVSYFDQSIVFLYLSLAAAVGASVVRPTVELAAAGTPVAGAVINAPDGTNVRRPWGALSPTQSDAAPGAAALRCQLAPRSGTRDAVVPRSNSAYAGRTLRTKWRGVETKR